MTSSVFSISFYDKELMIYIHQNKTIDQTYLLIPSYIFTDVLWATYGKAEIYEQMKKLYIGESFRVASNDLKQKYILITKTTNVSESSGPMLTTAYNDTNDIIVVVHNEPQAQFIDNMINNSTIYQRSKTKLPASPDGDEKTKDEINLSVLCTKTLTVFFKWIDGMIKWHFP
jgi:hypothetical protein